MKTARSMIITVLVTCAWLPLLGQVLRPVNGWQPGMPVFRDATTFLSFAEAIYYAVPLGVVAKLTTPSQYAWCSLPARVIWSGLITLLIWSLFRSRDEAS